MLRNIIVVTSLIALGAAAACADGGSKQVTPSATTTDDDSVGAVPNILIAVDDDPSLLTLIDLSSEETIAQVNAGYHPWPLLRPSAGELLVADIGGPDFEGRLSVFDIDDASEPKWTMRLPGRAVSTGWVPAWALSADERYVYYSRHAPGEQYPSLIGIIDLDAGGLVDNVRLPRGCGGYKALMAAGPSGARVVCSSGRFVTVEPDGAVSGLASLPLPEEARPFLGPVVEGCSSQGRGVPCSLNESGRLLGFRHLSGHTLSNLLAYDEARPDDIRHYALPEGITDFAPVSASTVALLAGNDAMIQLLDLKSGQITDELPAPEGTNWLVGPPLSGQQQVKVP